MTYARNWIEEWRRAEAEGPILSDLPRAKTAKSAKSRREAPFGSFDTFGTGLNAADDGDNACSQWRRSLDTLDPNCPPTGFPALWWRGLIRDADLFLATWGSQAADLGWTTLDLFGAHPKALRLGIRAWASCFSSAAGGSSRSPHRPPSSSNSPARA
jgi:hypothetical protein